MSSADTPPRRILRTARTRWTDANAARRDGKPEHRLLAKRGTQQALGRHGPEAALDLALRILARLPASAQRRRRLLASVLARLDARAATRLHAFAADLRRGYAMAATSAPRAAAERRLGSAQTLRFPADAPRPGKPTTPPARQSIFRVDVRRALPDKADARLANVQIVYASLIARVAAKGTPHG